MSFQACIKATHGEEKPVLSVLNGTFCSSRHSSLWRSFLSFICGSC